jgi:quercetin dioxygenase-like cupin family protein
MTILHRAKARTLRLDHPQETGSATTSWGEISRSRITAADTLGRLAVMDYRAPAGFSPPRHIHRNDDELFLILSGHIVLWTEAGSRIAGPGDWVLLPRGIAHSWSAYGDDGVHFQIIVTPGEFEPFFEIIERRGLTIGDVGPLTRAADEAGMDIVGPPLTDVEVAAILRGESV